MKYPLGEYSREEIFSKTGKNVDTITLEAVLAGKINAEDIKISPETLKKQAQVADEAGKINLAQNFNRGAELVNIPDDVILNIYNKLRPNRSTKAELLAIAETLKTKYKAEHCSALVLEACEVYEKRGILL